MSQVFGIAQAGQSFQAIWSHIGERVDALAAQTASSDALDSSFAGTVVELNNLKLQAAAAGAIFNTLDELAGELLTRPRR